VAPKRHNENRDNINEGESGGSLFNMLQGDWHKGVGKILHQKTQSTNNSNNQESEEYIKKEENENVFPKGLCVDWFELF